MWDGDVMGMGVLWEYVNGWDDGVMFDEKIKINEINRTLSKCPSSFICNKNIDKDMIF